jgi:hypothetical protein
MKKGDTVMTPDGVGIVCTVDEYRNYVLVSFSKNVYGSGRLRDEQDYAFKYGINTIEAYNPEEEAEFASDYVPSYLRKPETKEENVYEGVEEPKDYEG